MERGKVGPLAQSPAPIERILARAAETREDVRLIVDDLVDIPAGLPSLPAGQIVNSLMSLRLENAEPGDLDFAHVTTFIEKSWINANSVHKWSIQFNRFDEELDTWVPFPTKRVREDAQRITYTLVVPGFSTIAITGSPDLPLQIFDVTGLGVFPPQPRANEDIIISARVTNNSNQPAVYPAYLWLNDSIDETQVISLLPGETLPIRFNKLRPEGQFKIRVDRLFGDFTVGAVPTPLPAITPTATPTPVPREEGPPPTPEPTATRTPTPTATRVPPTPRPTATLRPGETPTVTPTPTATLRPGETPTVTPTPTATLRPGETPTVSPNPPKDGV